MFKTMYTFWLKSKNSNNELLKINLWSLDNIRLFKILSSTNLSYIIYNLNHASIKTVKTVRTNYSLESLINLFLLLSFTNTILFLVISYA